jgi:MFS family permease
VLSIGLISLLVGLVQSNSWGWTDPKTVVLLVVATILLAAFAPIERRVGRRALVPYQVIGNPTLAGSCFAIFCISAAFFAVLLYLPLFMQHQLGFSPLEAGAGIVPFLASFGAVSFLAGPLYNRLGAKALVVFGSAFVALGAFACSFVTRDSSYASLIAGMLLLGVGLGSFYPTATTAGVTSVRESQTSLAGGIFYMFELIGGSVGLALTTTVFEAARPPFVEGIQAGFRLDAAIALVGVVIALAFVGGKLPPLRLDRTPA